MKIPKDIAARKQSINPYKSMLIEADAGCGKTEQMARRYLSLLAHRPKPEGIFAITFTQKAASELKERIHKYLKMGTADNAPKEQHLIETWELAKSAIAEDTKNSWNLIKNPHQIKIQTIDSFCIDIVNKNILSNSYGCEISALEDASKTYELAAKTFIEKSEDITTISDFISMFDNNTHKAITKIAELLPKREQFQRELENIDIEKLQKCYKSAFQYELNEFSSELSKPIKNDIRVVIREIFESIESSAKTTFTAKEIHFFSRYNENYDSVNLILFCNIIITSDGKSFRKKYPSKMHVNEHTANLIQVILDESELSLIDALRIGSIPLEKLHDKTTSDLQIIAKVINGAISELKSLFKETLTLDFNEITLEAIKIVQSGQQATSNVTDLLIDEFQDTSASHHTLVKSILSWWNKEEVKTICAVGDPKQSLYLFRAASLGHFINVQQNGYENIEIETIRLSVNFRSYKSVIDWVNKVFKTAFPKKDNISQGAVKHSISEAFNTTEIPSVTINPTLCEGDKNINERKEAILVADQVEQHLKDVPHETVSILIRARSYIREIDKELKKRGIFYTGVDLVKLNEKQPIIDLVNLTKILAGKHDLVSFSGLIRSPFVGILQKDMHKTISPLASSKSEETLIEKISEALETLEISDDAKQRLYRLVNIINKSKPAFGNIKFANYLECVWHELEGDQFSTELQEADIRAFFDVISICEEENTIKDWALLEKTLDKLYMQPDESADRRIQIMTLHKSKGAEMDNVIIPGFHKPGSKSDSLILKWIDHPDPSVDSILLAPNVSSDYEPYRTHISISNRNKEILEMVRLIYVGATRAKKRLSIFFTVTEEIIKLTSKPNGTSMLGLIHKEISENITIDSKKEAYLIELIKKTTPTVSGSLNLSRYKQL